MFQLFKPLDSDVLNRLYPDTPDVLGKGFFEKVFEKLLSQARSRNDTHALVAHILQHASALAYIGEHVEAKAKIMKLAAEPFLSNYHKTIVASALRSPTYFSKGNDVESIYL